MLYISFPILSNVLPKKKVSFYRHNKFSPKPVMQRDRCASRACNMLNNFDLVYLLYTVVHICMDLQIPRWKKNYIEQRTSAG